MELRWHQASINTFKIRIFVSAESCCYNVILQEKHTELMTWHAPSLAENPCHTGNGFSKRWDRMKSFNGKKNACLETNTVSNNRKRSLCTYSQKYFLKRMLKMACNIPAQCLLLKLMHLFKHSQVLSKHLLKKGIKINLFKEERKAKFYSVSNPANPSPFKTLEYF